MRGTAPVKGCIVTKVPGYMINVNRAPRARFETSKENYMLSGFPEIPAEQTSRSYSLNTAAILIA